MALINFGNGSELCNLKIKQRETTVALNYLIESALNVFRFSVYTQNGQ